MLVRVRLYGRGNGMQRTGGDAAQPADIVVAPPPTYRQVNSKWQGWRAVRPALTVPNLLAAGGLGLSAGDLVGSCRGC